FNLRQLKEVYVDRTIIHDITAQEFLEKNPTCLLVYKTIHLDRWWRNLSTGWRDVFLSEIGADTTREGLHRLVEREAFQFKEARVNDLAAFSEFVRLKELHFSSTGIAEIPDMESFRSLRSLSATSSPLQRIGAISLLGKLEELDISNTPVSDLRGLETLSTLRTLNCAGTQIRRLDPLKGLVDLQSLDCSNTSVSRLDPVMYLSLQTLKAYNTRIPSREIEQFKGNNPDCHVVYYR
ncbi:MAG: leucine-rich repeat domain-containing protein, partial [Bacteroidota bacterium]|nr:leucine-rich repeat domain-containing protein [Bacteroidota bacterium]